MALDNVEYLPGWKKNGTVADRLDELAMIARKHPERFDRFVLVYVERLETGNSKYRTHAHGCNFSEAIGLFEAGKMDYYMEVSGAE